MAAIREIQRRDSPGSTDIEGLDIFCDSALIWNPNFSQEFCRGDITKCIRRARVVFTRTRIGFHDVL
jgi:hypothetical protein